MASETRKFEAFLGGGEYGKYAYTSAQPGSLRSDLNSVPARPAASERTPAAGLVPSGARGTSTNSRGFLSQYGASKGGRRRSGGWSRRSGELRGNAWNLCRGRRPTPGGGLPILIPEDRDEGEGINIPGLRTTEDIARRVPRVNGIVVK